MSGGANDTKKHFSTFQTLHIYIQTVSWSPKCSWDVWNDKRSYFESEFTITFKTYFFQITASLLQKSSLLWIKIGLSESAKTPKYFYMGLSGPVSLWTLDRSIIWLNKKYMLFDSILQEFCNWLRGELNLIGH